MNEPSNVKTETAGAVGSGDLLACPFCGSDAVLYESSTGWSVMCQNTEDPPCDIGNTHRDWTKEAAIEMWNRRVESVKLISALRRIKYICLTTTPGTTPKDLAHMVRLCIDAGITQHIDELFKANAGTQRPGSRDAETANPDAQPGSLK